MPTYLTPKEIHEACFQAASEASRQSDHAALLEYILCKDKRPETHAQVISFWIQQTNTWSAVAYACLPKNIQELFAWIQAEQEKAFQATCLQYERQTWRD